MVRFEFIILATPLSVVAQQLPLPPVLPLAVRSPYLNYWSHDPNVAPNWAMFWTKKVSNYIVGYGYKLSVFLGSL